MKPNPARIRALEQWHASQDCRDRGGHFLPEGHEPPTTETFDITSWGAPEPVLTVGPACTGCGTTILT